MEDNFFDAESSNAKHHNVDSLVSQCLVVKLSTPNHVYLKNSPPN